MITINLFVGSRYPVARKKIRQKAIEFLESQGIESATVDISIVGTRKIKELNESQLKHKGETDVLSFPQHERHQLNDFPLPDGLGPHLGDIVVSFPVAVESAKKFGKLIDDQIIFYIQHGLLHLLGYHHE